MKKYIIIFLFLPCLTLAQEKIEIKHLSNAINSVGAELNFLQDKNNHAFFTAIRDDDNDYVSSIYSSNLQLDQWSKGSYFSAFNSDYMQSGNLFITKAKMAYFTFCKADICAIYRANFKNKKWTKPKKLDERINQKESTSTQPTIAEINGKRFLYFVSDREGSFGGTDIWVCTIDSNGNFGNPVNCGNKINSKANEITPFFNPIDGQLYFSSDRKNGFGGFDIYKAKGNLALWENLILLDEPFNTPFDEMYLNFFTENKGHFSSNRSPALYLDKENCCNDIFSFEIKKQEKDTSKGLEKINNYLPLSLYFHNDEPDCCTMKTTTKLNYIQSYVSYFLLKKEYVKNSSSVSSIEDFFTNKLQENFNKLDEVLRKIKKALASGQKIELQIKGYASPLFASDYNINLSKRRIVSLLNYMHEFQNGSITQYFKNEQLVIIELPFGESVSNKNVSDNPRNKKLSVYSVEAAMARKIEIVRVTVKE
jgi:hypothetical protein